jgi:hypothetical protein|tara:strand:+ start:1677 stop:1853 length:177 start_codon:yes stop_codon:yes gene_type:complete
MKVIKLGNAIEIEFSVVGQYAYIRFFGKEHFKDFSGNDPLISPDDLLEIEIQIKGNQK